MTRPAGSAAISSGRGPSAESGPVEKEGLEEAGRSRASEASEMKDPVRPTPAEQWTTTGGPSPACSAAVEG